MDETQTPASAKGTDEPVQDSDRLKRAKGYVGEKYTAVSENVKTSYDSAQKAAKEKYGELRQKVDDVDLPAVMDQVRQYVRSNPAKALLISVGVGFVLGLLLRGGDDD